MKSSFANRPLRDLNLNANLLRSSTDDLSIVGAINGGCFEGRISFVNRGEKAGNRVSILYRGGTDVDRQQETEDVDGEVSFAAFDPLMSVKSTFTTLTGDLHRLTVDHRKCGLFSAAFGQSNLAVQLCPKALPNTESLLSVEVLCHRLPRRKVIGQKSPLTTGVQLVENPVDHVSPVILRLCKERLLEGYEWLDPLRANDR